MIRKCCCHWLRQGGKRGGRGFARPTSVSRLQVKKSRGTESGSEVCLLFHLATGEDSPPLPPLQGPAGEIPGRRTTGHFDSSVLSILCLTSSFLATVLLCPRFLLSPDRRVFFLPRSREAKHGKNGQGRDRIQTHRQLRRRICLPFSCNTVCIKTDPRYFCNEIDKLA